jgi:hypothetical protein
MMTLSARSSMWRTTGDLCGILRLKSLTLVSSYSMLHCRETAVRLAVR